MTGRGQGPRGCLGEPLYTAGLGLTPGRDFHDIVATQP
jgi:hypothetical protein